MVLAESSTCRALLASASRPPAAITDVSASSERHERRHQRAEGDEQDPEGQRDGDGLGAGEVLADGVVDGLVGRRGPELRHAQLRVAGGDAVDRAQHGRHAVGRLVRLALHGEEHDRGTAVTTHLARLGQRRADVGDAARRLDGADHVADGGSPGRGEDVAITLDLDEHLLGGGALEPGALERAGGGGRLAVAGLGGGQLLRPLPPIMAATSTNTSQPTIAFARCRALQRPILATIPILFVDLMRISPFSGLRLLSSTLDPGPSGSHWARFKRSGARTQQPM